MTEEPSQSDKEPGSDEIVVSLSGDIASNGMTRGEDETLHAGHQLRYTAKLYKLDSSKPAIPTDGNNRVQTIEQLAKDGNKIIFKNVADGEKYFVTIFADYIDENVNKDGNGHYPDKYYSTPDGQGADAIKCIAPNSRRFNNDNLDCFVLVSGSFTKEKNSGHEITSPLKRIVTRVKVISTGGDISALKDVTVSKLNLTDNYQYVGGSASFTANSVPETTVEVADRTQDLLFFFYTFSLNESDVKDAESGGFSFTLNPNDGYEFQKSVWTVGNGIRYVANSTYKVKGDLLLTSKVPSNVAKLSVSVDNSWQEDEKDVNQ